MIRSILKTSMTAVPMTAVAMIAVPLLAAGLSAQADDRQKPVEVTLSTATETVLASAAVILDLRIQVNQESSVDATLLCGHNLKSTIDGKAGPRLKDTTSGKVKLAAGTMIRRRIEIPMSQILPDKNPPKDMVRITLEWANLIGVGATVLVAPDLSKVHVEDLDLAKTTVTLVTNFGNMTVKFRPEKAPNTVANFVKLAKDGFYNGTSFHRVYPGFMIQGGCPNTKEGATGQPGTGNSGKTLKAEFNDIRHVRGVLSMARSNDPDSASCQFFIMHAENRGLDGKYTAFGELTSGFETLDKICSIKLGYNGQGEQSRPLQPVNLKLAIVEPVFKKSGK